MRITMTITTLIMLLAGIAVADERPMSQAGPLPPTAAKALAADEIQARKALHTELKAARDVEAAQVAELSARLPMASPTERDALQRQISALKDAGVRRALEIQLDHARGLGKTEWITQLEASLLRHDERLANEVVVVKPDAIPARDRGGESR